MEKDNVERELPGIKGRSASEGVGQEREMKNTLALYVRRKLEGEKEVNSGGRQLRARPFHGAHLEGYTE